MHRDPIREYGDEIALVTPTRSARTSLDGLLGSLDRACSRPVRVVVADTGGAIVPGGADVVRLAEAVGRGAAVNRVVAGLDPAVGWVAVAEPTVQWGPGALDALLEAGARHPRAGLTGPRLRSAAGPDRPSGGAVPALLDVRRGRIGTVVARGPVGWVSGVCVLVRRAAWDSVDGFDPRYGGNDGPVDLADVDLGDRLGRAGWLVVHEPAAEVTVGASDGRDGEQGILEPLPAGLRRYTKDRSAGLTRAVLTLGTRGRPA